MHGLLLARQKGLKLGSTFIDGYSKGFPQPIIRTGCHAPCKRRQCTASRAQVRVQAKGWERKSEQEVHTLCSNVFVCNHPHQLADRICVWGRCKPQACIIKRYVLPDGFGYSQNMCLARHQYLDLGVKCSNPFFPLLICSSKPVQSIAAVCVRSQTYSYSAW